MEGQGEIGVGTWRDKRKEEGYVGRQGERGGRVRGGTRGKVERAGTVASFSPHPLVFIYFTSCSYNW